MELNTFLEKIKSDSKIDFNQLIEVVDEHYNFSPTAFKNGDTYNEAGKNSGSCKLFYFANLNCLSKEETLKCFGDYYKGVLNTPNGVDHQNIRNFMKSGWAGIKFEGTALTPKN